MNSKGYVVVNTDILNENINNVKECFKKYENIIVNLSHNAYGHGLEIMKFFVSRDIKNFFVDNLDDALKIRKFGNDFTIICSELIDKEYIYDAINNNIIIRVSNIDYLKQIIELNLKDDLSVELLIDTGCGSFGINNINEVYDLLKDEKHIHVKTITTILSDTEIDSPDYDWQVSKLHHLLDDINLENIIVYLNQKAGCYKKLSFCNGILLGDLIYGFKKNIERNFLDNLKFNNNLKKYNILNKINHTNIIVKPSIRIETKVISINEYYKNSIFYNVQFEDKALIAILPMGYNDGLNDNIEVIIGNNTYEVLNVTHNYTYILVNDEIKVNDMVMIMLPNYIEDAELFLNNFGSKLSHKTE
jgi:alanine racemase